MTINEATRGAQDEWRIDLEERLRMFVAQGRLDQSVLDSYRAERSRLAAAERLVAAGRTFHHASRHGQMIGDVLQDIDGDRLSIVAPEDAAVLALCERVGFGAVMDSAYRQWRRRDPVGAFLLGPCVGTVRPADAATAATVSATDQLIVRFVSALREKADAAEAKYGWNDGWLDPRAVDAMRDSLHHHIEKGDPRDVALYCAFLWHHGASTAATESEEA